MNAVANAAGLRKPSLYHHLRSKTNILVKIHTDHTRHPWQRLDGSRRAEVSPDVRLREVLYSIVTLMKTRPQCASLFRVLPGASRGHARIDHRGPEGVSRGRD